MAWKFKLDIFGSFYFDKLTDNFISLAVHDIETCDIGTRSSNYLPPKWLMIRGFYQAAKSSCAGNGDFVFALTSTLKAYLARTTKIWFLLWFFIHFLISVPSFLPTTTTNSILTLYGQCRYTLFLNQNSVQKFRSSYHQINLTKPHPT